MSHTILAALGAGVLIAASKVPCAPAPPTLLRWKPNPCKPCPLVAGNPTTSSPAPAMTCKPLKLVTLAAAKLGKTRLIDNLEV